MPARRAVFLDKDGTLIVDEPYNVDPSLVRLASGAAEGVRALHSAGYGLAVVSNQSGVARGLFRIEALGPIEDRLRDLLADLGVPLADFRCCPHLPGGSVASFAVSCDCRKPAPGMILASAEAIGADPTRSWMVGDKLDDVEAGRRAGCRTVLIAEAPPPDDPPIDPIRRPHLVASDMAEAARLILLDDSEADPRGAAFAR